MKPRSFKCKMWKVVKRKKKNFKFQICQIFIYFQALFVCFKLLNIKMDLRGFIQIKYVLEKKQAKLSNISLKNSCICDNVIYFKNRWMINIKFRVVITSRGPWCWRGRWRERGGKLGHTQWCRQCSSLKLNVGLTVFILSHKLHICYVYFFFCMSQMQRMTIS